MGAPAAALMRLVRVRALGLVAAFTCGLVPLSGAGASMVAHTATALGAGGHAASSTVFDQVSVKDVWSRTRGSVTIAVVDTGVDPAAGILGGYDAASGAADGADLVGHGSEVAAAASTVCPGCAILPVRVTGRDGAASEATLAAGIVWAADHGARIINVSLVAAHSSAALDAAVAYAQRHGALVVAAAGNDGALGSGYPGALPGVLSVAAATPAGGRYSFSNHGGGVSLSGPGCASVHTRGHTQVACGTSIAAPIVAGVAGLLASAHPEAAPQDLAAALAAGADRLGDTRFGRVNAAKSLLTLDSAKSLH